MKRNSAISILLVVCTVGSMQPGSADPAVPTQIVTSLTGPESAVWDATTEAWYISFGGFSGRGGVARLAEGSSEPVVFTGDMSGPQGVTIFEGTMYVADGDVIHVIDMADPEDRSTISIRAANDLDVDDDTGDVYVTDLGGNTIWRILAGSDAAEAFATINAPDGIYVKDGGVYIANFALGGPGGLYRFDIATGQRSTIVELPGATLDGLESDGEDWLVTDFSKGHLLRITEDGTVTPAGQFLVGSADLGLNPETRVIAVPNLLLNNVIFADLDAI
ncbi:MAG: hypothetical protein ACLGH3_00345 [Actinomycetota bacterium]